MNNAKNIYLSYGNYFEYKGDFLYDSTSMVAYDYHSFISSLDDDAFITGAAGSSTETEDPFIYLYKTESETELDYGFPYLSTSIRLDEDNFSNCSPTAGLEILMYWDRTYTDLIVNFTPTKSTLVDFIPPHTYIYETVYKTWDSISTSEDYLLGGIHDDIYDEMGTSTILGTTDYGFYYGLKDYFLDQGETLTRNVIAYGAYGTTVPWTNYKNQINVNRPVVLQLFQLTNSDFTFIEDVPSDIEIVENYTVVYGEYYDKTTYVYNQYNGAHTVVGFGYKTFNYYSRNYYGYTYLSRTDNFMIVANGWANVTSGIAYINITNDDIYKAYSIYPTG